MKIYFVQADTEGCAYYRTYLPGIALSRLPGVEVVASPFLDGDRHVRWADVIVWQRQHRDELVPFRELARRLGKVQLYDIDDLLEEIPEWSTQYAHYPRGCRALAGVREWIRACDHLVVPTRPLGEAYRELTGRDFTVVPNALDFSQWQRKENASGTLRIGWAGSTTHAKDLAEAQYALFRVLEERPDAELVLMGYDAGWKHRLAASPSPKDVELARRLDVYPWFPDAPRYPRALANLRLDIAVAPLVPQLRFNRCKSNVKFLEYAALEIPVVASRAEPYLEIEDGVTGFLAANPYDFYKKLLRLVEDPELRRRIGRAARAYAESRYDVSRTARDLLSLYGSLLDRAAAGAHGAAPGH